MNATPEAKTMISVSAGQVLKAGQQIVDQNPSTAQIQDVLRSGILKTICHVDWSKVDRHDVEHVLGLYRSASFTVYHRDTLFEWAKRTFTPSSHLPRGLFVQDFQSVLEGILLEVKNEDMSGRDELCALLTRFGYRAPTHQELIAFAVFRRGDLRQWWPLVPQRGRVQIFSATKFLPMGTHGEASFPAIEYPDGSTSPEFVKCGSGLGFFPGEGFMLGVKRARVINTVMDTASELVDQWSDSKRSAFEQRTGLSLPPQPSNDRASNK